MNLLLVLVAFMRVRDPSRLGFRMRIVLMVVRKPALVVVVVVVRSTVPSILGVVAKYRLRGQTFDDPPFAG